MYVSKLKPYLNQKANLFDQDLSITNLEELDIVNTQKDTINSVSNPFNEFYHEMEVIRNEILERTQRTANIPKFIPFSEAYEIALQSALMYEKEWDHYLIEEAEKYDILEEDDE